MSDIIIIIIYLFRYSLRGSLVNRALSVFARV